MVAKYGDPSLNFGKWEKGPIEKFQFKFSKVFPVSTEILKRAPVGQNCDFSLYTFKCRKEHLHSVRNIQTERLESRN